MQSTEHRFLHVFLLFGLASLPANAQAPEARFDVNCDGISMGGAFKDIIKPENRSAQTRSYRIDLDSKRWCADKCDETFAIHDLDAKFITLKYEKNEISETIISLNRENGKILDRFTIFSTADLKEDLILMFTGECKRGNFSGFPALRF